MLRALLVDDEEPARLRLRAMLAEHDDIEIVDEAGDGEEALERIGRSGPDLVFLDIQMPGLSGLEVAASLEPPRPRIIFCTAFDQYAIEAFEHHATAYLQKPVHRKRLGRALDRVRGEVDEQRRNLREAESASRTQERLLPQSTPEMAHLDYAGVCRAARGVGGDYYDFLELDRDVLGLALGDVSGKGMFAGLLVAGLQARIQSIAARSRESLGEFIGVINRQMHSATDSNRYATLFYGVWDDRERTLSYVNAGHHPPLVLRSNADGATETLRLESQGAPVGMLADARYSERQVRLRSGDLLLIYSDGLVEAPDAAGDEFGAERLEAAAREHAGLDATGMRDAIVQAVDRFTGGPSAHDDLTLVVARVR